MLVDEEEVLFRPCGTGVYQDHPGGVNMSVSQSEMLKGHMSAEDQTRVCHMQEINVP